MAITNYWFAIQWETFFITSIFTGGRNNAWTEQETKGSKRNADQ